MKYRQKSMEVDAIQWDNNSDDGINKVREFVGKQKITKKDTLDYIRKHGLTITNDDGIIITVYPMNYVIKNKYGYYSTFTPDEFADRFELIEDDVYKCTEKFLIENDKDENYLEVNENSEWKLLKDYYSTVVLSSSKDTLSIIEVDKDAFNKHFIKL